MVANANAPRPAPASSSCPACLRAVSARRTADDGRCYACANVCSACKGGGIVGDERTHRTCSDCSGTGLARTLADLIQERRALLQEMRSSRDVTTRETLRASVAVLDVEIAEMRRGEAA